ncbi:MAG: glucosamine-6-phosphate deaminase [Bacteroidetes bacterium]|nr:glucosamine-6-phosphate deaminase [Bacteroidota bacterium]
MAAEMFAKEVEDLLAVRAELNVIFAAAPSQNEFLAQVRTYPLPWNRINAFHMDEYTGLPAEAPQGFGNFLRARLFDRVGFKSVHFINGNAPDIQAECRRYAALLEQYPVDIVCMGIGENGHLAFNDPPVADFEDPLLVKTVLLEETCRLQQVNDGCFETLDQVPVYAITLTIPALLRAGYISCVVPGERKARAVFNTLHQEIDSHYPSSILRQHPNAVLFIDRESGRLLSERNGLQE